MCICLFRVELPSLTCFLSLSPSLYYQIPSNNLLVFHSALIVSVSTIKQCKVIMKPTKVMYLEVRQVSGRRRVTFFRTEQRTTAPAH